jgi:hypothetical protein
MSVEDYITRIRKVGPTAKEEAADITGRLVKIGAYEVAKFLIEHLEKQEKEISEREEKRLKKIEENTDAMIREAKKMRINENWRCRHGHTKEQHPYCYTKYLRKDL